MTQSQAIRILAHSVMPKQTTVTAYLTKNTYCSLSLHGSIVVSMLDLALSVYPAKTHISSTVL